MSEARDKWVGQIREIPEGPASGPVECPVFATVLWFWRGEARNPAGLRWLQKAGSAIAEAGRFRARGWTSKRKTSGKRREKNEQKERVEVQELGVTEKAPELSMLGGGAPWLLPGSGRVMRKALDLAFRNIALPH